MEAPDDKVKPYEPGSLEFYASTNVHLRPGPLSLDVESRAVPPGLFVFGPLRMCLFPVLSGQYPSASLCVVSHMSSSPIIQADVHSRSLNFTHLSFPRMLVYIPCLHYMTFPTNDEKARKAQ
jgi:hypothetical protein